MKQRIPDIDVHVRRLLPVETRHRRAAQRQVAQEIRRSAAGPLLSHSHSRGIIVVASAHPPVTKLGVDAEMIDPARPWREIAAVYMPEAAGAELAASDFCRLWTFGEAHFKAFGETPSPELLAGLAKSRPVTGAIEFAPKRFWCSEELPEGFWISVVWQVA